MWPFRFHFVLNAFFLKHKILFMQPVSLQISCLKTTDNFMLWKYLRIKSLSNTLRFMMSLSKSNSSAVKYTTSIQNPTLDREKSFCTLPLLRNDKYDKFSSHNQSYTNIQKGYIYIYIYQWARDGNARIQTSNGKADRNTPEQSPDYMFTPNAPQSMTTSSGVPELKSKKALTTKITEKLHKGKVRTQKNDNRLKREIFTQRTPRNRQNTEKLIKTNRI